MNGVVEIFHDFLKQVKNHPCKVAIYHLNREITYHELACDVDRWAHVICSQCNDKTPVVIHMNRSPQLIAAMLACWKLGRPYIPLEPTHPLDRKLSILEDFEISLANIPGILPLKSNVSKNVAYVLFTSGTTGKPKGIEINAQGVKNLIDWADEYYDKTVIPHQNKYF